MFELIDPAGPTLSRFRQGIGLTIPFRMLCGVDTSPLAWKSFGLRLLVVMPSGAKIRFRIVSSYPSPDARPTTSPAAMTMMF